MEQYLFGRKDVHYTYDFREKCVKVQRSGGEPQDVNKYSLGYDIQSISFYNAADTHSYAECAQLLLELLEDKKFNNVTIIK